MFFLSFLLVDRITSLQPFQQAWQAAVPIPLTVHFDVPYRPPSFIQDSIGNIVPLRLHGPEETTSVIDEELDAVKFQETTESDFRRQQEKTQRRLLVETIDRSVENLVNELMAPLRALPNPLG